MTPEQARERLRYLAAERQRNAEAEPEAILDAIKLGVRPTDIANDIARTREHVRRVRESAEKAGLLPRVTDQA